MNKITSDAQQQFLLTGITGITINLNLRYMPFQQIWTMDVSQGDFTANGIQVVAAPNLLRQFRNNIKFGLACLTNDALDPLYIDDFSAQRAGLYLLTAAEVLQIEGAYF